MDGMTSNVGEIYFSFTFNFILGSLEDDNEG